MSDESNVVSGVINIDGSGLYTIADSSGKVVGGGGSGQSWGSTGIGNGIIGGNMGMGTVMATTSGIYPMSPTALERPRYGWNDRLSFADGEVIEVDLSYFGRFKEAGKQWIVEAMIMGKQPMDSYDNWIVDLGDFMRCESYPYGIIVIPMACICKPELMEWEK